jgi:acid phosphatase family membrane protein YuiD
MVHLRFKLNLTYCIRTTSTAVHNRTTAKENSVSEEMARSWRRLHNEELHNLKALTIIIRAIKSRRLRLTRHVTRMGGMRNSHKILVSTPEDTTRKTYVWMEI